MLLKIHCWNNPSRMHFAKAEGLPFTQALLKWLLQYDGLTPFGELIYQGHSNLMLHPFDELTKAILQNLQIKIPHWPQTSHPLNYDCLLDGIKKWPEHTTTSPSGCHLGIYKALSKHVVWQKDKDNTDPMTPNENNIGMLKQGRDILYMIFDLMLIMLLHTYPLQHWCKVWTMFIEKELGNPDINHLCCIMIFEADWQLLLKWHSSYGFLPTTKFAGTLVDSQGGGWKGRSAINQVTQQILEAEAIHLNQRPALNIYLDLHACFDMIVEACHNLACWCHGANIEYLWLHAWTHQLMCYYVHHIWCVCWLQHLWPTPLAWHRSRCSQCGTPLHCTFWYNDWCISYQSCTQYDAQPNPPHEHYMQPQGLHQQCCTACQQSSWWFNPRPPTHSPNPTMMVGPIGPSHWQSLQPLEMLWYALCMGTWQKRNPQTQPTWLLPDAYHSRAQLLCTSH